MKPELGLMYPGADYVSESIKKKYNEIGKLPIVLDCINILKLDYSAAKVRTILHFDLVVYCFKQANHNCKMLLCVCRVWGRWKFKLLKFLKLN